MEREANNKRHEEQTYPLFLLHDEAQASGYAALDIGGRGKPETLLDAL
jgi:hypothetical protein